MFEVISHSYKAFVGYLGLFPEIHGETWKWSEVFETMEQVLNAFIIYIWAFPNIKTDEGSE